MDDGDNRRFIENTTAANFFNDKASSAAPRVGPHVSFSRPQQSLTIPHTAAQPSENRPPPSSRAQSHFERESQSLPPIFPQHGTSHFGHLHTPPISPLSLFSPRTGFPGPLLPSLRAIINDRDERAPLTPISPMNYTPVPNSPMDFLPSPMFHVGASSHNGGDTARCMTPQVSAIDPDMYKRSYGGRHLNDLNGTGFSGQFHLLPLSPNVSDPMELTRNAGTTLDTMTPNQVNLRGVMAANISGAPVSPGHQRFFQHHVQQNPASLSPVSIPESPMFHSGTQHLLPTQQENPQYNPYPSGQASASSVFQSFSQNPNSPSPVSPEAWKAANFTEESHHENYGNSGNPNGSPSIVLPSPQHHGNTSNTGESDRMEVAGDRYTPMARNMTSTSSGLRVLPHIMIDRPLVRKALLLQQKVVRSPHFSSFVFNLKESHRMRGDEPIGGTVRRRSDLVKPVTSIEDFGYPSSDREDIHRILDTTPGLSRENVEYLKNIVYSQLETVKRGAREALYQFAIILVEQLRYRVMKKEDILSLQCSVVDRFVVARNCILEKYTQYVRSRRWIENMSTNQRRGCLTHKQNNILRMWLYQNFRDPYPDEDSKEMMMNETKLSLEQVNNWLINARSRFWKPSMDYFDRCSLERKMVMLIRHRMIMSTEEKIKAASSRGVLSDLKRRSKRQLE